MVKIILLCRYISRNIPILPPIEHNSMFIKDIWLGLRFYLFFIGLLGESEVQLYFFLCTSAVHGGGWSAPRPGRLAPEKDRVSIVQEAGWASEQVWIGAKNIAPTGIRSPDFPARSESLYRLRYLGSLLWIFMNVYEIHNKDNMLHGRKEEYLTISTMLGDVDGDYIHLQVITVTFRNDGSRNTFRNAVFVALERHKANCTTCFR